MGTDRTPRDRGRGNKGKMCGFRDGTSSEPSEITNQKPVFKKTLEWWGPSRKTGRRWWGNLGREKGGRGRDEGGVVAREGVRDRMDVKHA